MARNRQIIVNQIQAQQKRIEVIDERIGRIMTRRADLEDRLGDLYAELNALPYEA